VAAAADWLLLYRGQLAVEGRKDHRFPWDKGTYVARVTQLILVAGIYCKVGVGGSGDEDNCCCSPFIYIFVTTCAVNNVLLGLLLYTLGLATSIVHFDARSLGVMATKSRMHSCVLTSHNDDSETNRPIRITVR
jgi:hypothetical protein